MTSAPQLLAAAFPAITFKPNLLLSEVTYFKLGGPAEVFADAKSSQDIQELVRFCRQNSIPFRIIGGASNVIAPDEGLPGLTIRAANETYEVLDHSQDGQRTIVRVGAGYKTALFVRKTIDDGLAGLEYFLGVPGRLGGAVYNNAHYLSDLIGDHISRVNVLTPSNDLIWLEADECEFEYDSSRFQDSQEAIIEIEFSLPRGDKSASMKKVEEATKYRAETQPLGEPSSGCIFQNVANNERLRELFPQFAEKKYISGGFLIDQAGLKGTREGGIEVSHKHAAFFVNKGGGTAAEVKTLIKKVKEQVQQQFGAELQEEVFYLR